jgi:putative ABC transport system ATP-binding protein
MLEINSLSKTFNPATPNEVRALDMVNCKVEKGSFVVLLGTNGSGKSTLLNAVAGSFMPDSGKIVLNGVDITNFAEHKRAKYIGRVFQNPFSGTAPDMSIAENLTLAVKRGCPRGLGWALPKSYLEDFRRRIAKLNMGLQERIDSPIGKLSGGQRQALTLLMATWLKPELLLLDEHTAALDPKTANRVIQLTEELISKDNLTTMMVTHSMQQAVNMGDRILMLHNGKIVYDIKGEEKKRIKTGDLLALFDEIRRKEQIDPTTAEMLMRNYV